MASKLTSSVSTEAYVDARMSMRGWREKVERDEPLGVVRDVAPESFLFLLFLVRGLRYARS
jgi:hypothetical protein